MTFVTFKQTYAFCQMNMNDPYDKPRWKYSEIAFWVVGRQIEAFGCRGLKQLS
jgi:hypothetical protein